MGPLLLIGLYLLPAIVASCRHHHNASAIAVVNIFLGWTFLGWVVALAWACAYTDGRQPSAPPRKLRRLPNFGCVEMRDSFARTARLSDYDLDNPEGQRILTLRLAHDLQV